MKIIFLGAANPETGRMIRAVERAQPNFKVLGFIDNDPKKKGTTFLEFPVFGGFEVLDKVIDEDVYFVNLITGSTKTRYETSLYMAQKGCKFANFVHPSIDLTMTTMGVGNYIQEGVIIQADARIGNNSSIHMGALVAHEVTVGDSVFIAHACSISGGVQIGDGAFIGTNATIIPRLRIGMWATIGAGAVVIKDVPDYATVVGNPATVVKVSEPIYTNGDIFGRVES
ncbi:acetyltransferase [Thermodesulfovibrionales bacterium]|nr:acetyltransferase [Thermodesulfovibrionales bacterium]